MKDDPASPSYPVGTIAKLFMMTERRVQQLVKKGIIPKNERGRYELVPVVQGYVRYLQEIAQGKTIDTTDYHAEKARLVKLQADKAHLEVEEIADRLVRSSDVRTEWEALLGTIKTRLLAVPSKAAPLVVSQTDPGAVMDLLDSQIREVLMDLYTYGDNERKEREGLAARRHEDSEADAEAVSV